jgi:hypothetical protein
MSNIREVEGVFVNLDLVQQIEVFKGSESFKIAFIFNASPPHFHYNTILTFGINDYKTREEAECKVREIIENQDNQYRKTK